MAADPLHELVDTARRLGLLSSAQSEQVTKEFQADKPSTFSEGASRLIAKKTLTAMQVELLQAGKGDSLLDIL